MVLIEFRSLVIPYAPTVNGRFQLLPVNLHSEYSFNITSILFSLLPINLLNVRLRHAGLILRF